MITLPEQPWKEGDTFTVEETGVIFTYDSEKWLAANGEEFDGDLYATKAQLDRLAEESALTDNSLFKAIEEESTKTNVAVTALQVEMNNHAKQSQSADKDLQSQIDGLDEKIDAIDIPDGVDLTPVTDRLDEIEEVLPKAPIVIPPVDLGRVNTLVDHFERPSGTDAPPQGECWMWHMDAGRTASGNTPANEMKVSLPADAVGNIILEGTTEVWFKQGDRVQKWNVENGGWFTFGNLWHMSAKSTEGDNLVSGQPYEVYYIDPNATGDDLIDAISRVESKADDRKLQAEIEQIALGLETLLMQREAGKWSYKGAIADGIPSKPGEFSLGSDDLSASDNIIILNQTDLDAKFHGFGDVDVGDYVEIVDLDKPDEYALFVIDSEPDGDGIVSFNLKLKDKGNNFLVGTTCEIRFFAINEQNLDITELDQRYLKLTGGTVTGNLRFKGEGLHLGYIDDNNQNWIQFNFGQTTEYKGFYSTDDAIATRKRVEAAVEGLASEEWVTEQIEGIEIPDVGDGYATEEYVDQKVYQSKFLPGQQVAKVGSSSDATGAFWIIDGALYCKV